MKAYYVARSRDFDQTLHQGVAADQPARRGVRARPLRPGRRGRGRGRRRADQRRRHGLLDRPPRPRRPEAAQRSRRSAPPCPAPPRSWWSRSSPRCGSSSARCTPAHEALRARRWPVSWPGPASRRAATRAPAPSGGDVVVGHLSDKVTGDSTYVLLPTGRIDLTVGKPVDEVTADQAERRGEALGTRRRGVRARDVGARPVRRGCRAGQRDGGGPAGGGRRAPAVATRRPTSGRRTSWPATRARPTPASARCTSRWTATGRARRSRSPTTG